MKLAFDLAYLNLVAFIYLISSIQSFRCKGITWEIKNGFEGRHVFVTNLCLRLSHFKPLR